MTSDKLVDNKTGTTSISFGETLLGGNLCCFYYLAVVKRNHLDPRQCPIGQRLARSRRRKPRYLSALSRFAALERLRGFPAPPKFRSGGGSIAGARPARMNRQYRAVGSFPHQYCV